ncbi:trigger factor [Candidatus Saganbacteria bacterium]|nr:trigger factor [Candidatus Saganbacteria bacterium]
MKIRSNVRDANKVTLEVEEDYSYFAKALEVALTAAGKEIKVPGFRPGKAPKEIVERALNHDYLESRAAQNLISQLYGSVISEAKIEPIDYPHVEIIQQQKHQPFVFKLVIAVYPEVQLGRYHGISVEKPAVKITAEDVDKVFGSLQERFAKIGPDGKKEILPLDDEFAKQVSKFGTLAELKVEIKATMLKDRQTEAEAEVKNRLIAAAAADAKLEIPQALVEHEIDIMLDELRHSLASSNLTLEDYLLAIKKDEKIMRDELRKSAEVRARGKIVLLEIAQAEKLLVTTEELTAELEHIAGHSGEKLEQINRRLGADGLKYMNDYLLRQKALDFLHANAKIKEAE